MGPYGAQDWGHGGPLGGVVLPLRPMREPVQSPAFCWAATRVLWAMVLTAPKYTPPIRIGVCCAVVRAVVCVLRFHTTDVPGVGVGAPLCYQRPGGGGGFCTSVLDTNPRGVGGGVREGGGGVENFSPLWGHF